MSLRMGINLWSKSKETVLGKLTNQLLDFIVFSVNVTFLLTRHQLLPRHVTFVNHGIRIGLVHKSLLQSKDIRWLAIRNLVRSEPFTNGIEHTWHLFFNIFNVIQKGCPLVFGINRHDLPVGFAFVNHTQDTEDLGRTNGTWLNDASADFTDIQRVIVSAAAFGIRVNVSGVFPCLGKTTIIEKYITLFELAQRSLLFILLDGVTDFIRGNLVLFASELGDFTNKVEARRVQLAFWINVRQRNIVPEGDNSTALRVGSDTVFQSIFFTSRGEVQVLVGTEG
mmetsp:Transcript_29520/g.48712  ORF Transcript_29520/g.48712 Transcript_29520/m.48712 type:complete len:281 (+) Transcript_29520:207-1049(+)